MLDKQTLTSYRYEIGLVSGNNNFDRQKLQTIFSELVEHKLSNCIVIRTFCEDYASGLRINVQFKYQDKGYKLVVIPAKDMFAILTLEREEDKFHNENSRSKVVNKIDNLFSKDLKKLLPKHRKYKIGDMFILNDNVHKKETLFRITNYQALVNSHNLSRSNNKVFYYVECDYDTRVFRIEEKNIKNICHGL
jgi:hypothetical protein